MARKLRIETCRYIPITELVPKQWAYWFYATISEDAPFSWGDNNRTMIRPDFFIDHCDRRIPGSGYVCNIAYEAWRKKIANIPRGVYIDMEN